MRLLTRALGFCGSAILQLDRTTLCRRGKVCLTGFRMAIAKRFDTLVRGRIIAKNPSTPIHSEQPATVPIAIDLCASVKSVVQKLSHQTPSETHANPAWGKHSTTKLTNRRVNTRMKSAIGSPRWSRAGSVLTTAISGWREKNFQVNTRPTAIPLHGYAQHGRELMGCKSPVRKRDSTRR